MADGKVDGLYIFKNGVRAPYLTVITPKPFKDKLGKAKGEDKFSGTFLLDPAVDQVDLEGMKAKMTAVAAASWPGRDLKELHFPIASGDARANKSQAEKKKDLPFLRGKFVLDARSKFKVALSVLENGNIVELADELSLAKYKGKFYGGCWVAPVVNFVTYPGQAGAKDGITAYLQAMIWIKDDTRIGGFDAQTLFANYKGTVNAGYDPSGATAEGSQGIPF